MADGGGGGPPPGPMVRRLAVEVVDARDLVPKDGLGTSSAYAVVDFDGQRKRTRTVPRDLSPQWHERLEFAVPDPANMHAEALDVSLYHDRRFNPGGGGGKNHFLGRVRIYGSQFSRRGEEGIVYFPLEKRSLLSWVRGEVGLKVYFYDEPAGGPPPPPPPSEEKPPEQQGDNAPPPEVPPEQPRELLPEMPAPTEAAVEVQQQPGQPPVYIVEEAQPMHPPMHGPMMGPPMYGPHGPMPPPMHGPHGPMPPPMHGPHGSMPPPMHGPMMGPPMHCPHGPPPPESSSHPEPEPAPEPEPRDHPQYPPEVQKTRMASSTERVVRHPSGGMGPDYCYATSPRVISGRFASTGESVEPVQPSSYDLVEPMRYLFVRVVRVRGIRACEGPYVKVQAGPHSLRSRPGRDVSGTGNPEWNQVFAISHARPGDHPATLEISVWDGGAPSPADAFLGGVCFDLSDVPVRDQPDGGPLAPQWYRLEGSETTGDVMVAVWIGTQADDAFPEAWSTDAPYAAYTRSKVYQSPKLWYLRASVIEAQDLRVPAPPPGLPFDVRVKMQLGFQSARTRRSVASSGGGSAFAWSEDLMFVASEPLDDTLVVLVEDRSMIKEPELIGHATIPVSSVEQRLDERQIVASRWFNLEGNHAADGPPGAGMYSGRVHLRLCLEGGYHVLDEAAHVCSDYRPTAKQLWKPPVGVLELGIIGACGLLPMKTKGGGAKGSTDAYCVAKYGKKWVRTRTVTDSLNPRWNEQYTWQVYDPCTVLTVAVFDNWRMFASPSTGGEDRQDYRVGKVRLRVSTLETNRAYTASYPLLVLLRSGLKKMGEVQLAVRFSSPQQLPDTWATYTSPLLPRMHYLRPIGVAQQEALRGAAVRTVAAWLARCEPPLGPEVVRHVLDADAHTWSVRRAKANWFRVMGVLAWAVGLARWLDGVRRWRSPPTTVLVHALYLVLVWYPELVVPTASLYVFMIGLWYYRFRPRCPVGMDARLSQADTVDGDEMEEEFDPVPPPDVLRVRYERLRTLAGRVQRVMGDVAAQGERLQALVSWRDPRASRIFVGVCLAVAVALYAMPPKMVAVAGGFYYLRHPMFRDPMPAPALNFFRRLPSLSDRLL